MLLQIQPVSGHDEVRLLNLPTRFPRPHFPNLDFDILKVDSGFVSRILGDPNPTETYPVFHIASCKLWVIGETKPMPKRKSPSPFPVQQVLKRSKSAMDTDCGFSYILHPSLLCLLVTCMIKKMTYH